MHRPPLPDASKPQRPRHRLPICCSSVVVEDELVSFEAKTSCHFPTDIGWIQCSDEVMSDRMRPNVYDIRAKIGIIAVAPGLKEFLPAAIAAAAGLSTSTAKTIRSGRMCPQPPHWAALLALLKGS